MSDKYKELCGLANYIFDNHFKDKAGSTPLELIEDSEGVISQIDNMIFGVIGDNKKLIEHKCLDYYDDQTLLAELLSRTYESDAPFKTTYGRGMKTFIVGIGADEIATVALHYDAVDILRGK